MNRFIVMGRVLVLTAMLGCVAGSWADEAKPLAEDPAVEKRLLDISGEMLSILSWLVAQQRLYFLLVING